MYTHKIHDNLFFRKTKGGWNLFKNKAYLIIFEVVALFWHPATFEVSELRIHNIWQRKAMCVSTHSWLDTHALAYENIIDVTATMAEIFEDKTSGLRVVPSFVICADLKF